MHIDRRASSQLVACAALGAAMHLKDYAGGEAFLGYCPLGQAAIEAARSARAYSVKQGVAVRR